LRTVKFSLLIASVALICVQCGGKPAPDAWAAMQKNKFARIGTSPFNIPFESAQGPNFEGYDVDLGEEIAKDLGYPTKWIPINEFDKTFEALKNGEIEMIISAVAITEERKNEFAFSDPYFDSGNTLARRRDNPAIKDLASLAGKRVGVQSGRTGDIFMATQRDAANVTTVRFQTLDDALGALNRGEIDAVVGDEPIITYSINKSYGTNLITTGAALTHNQYAVVVRPEETKLLGKINETIARLRRAGALNAMREKWFQNVMAEAKGEREALQREEQLKAAPKAISVRFIKQAGSKVEFDRFDGFNIVLVGAAGTFTSTAISTDEAGVSGGCKFPNPIPPGDYTLNLSRISLSRAIKIEKKAVTSMTITLKFSGKGLDIEVE
jgi:ABC-type amino acid transport substrate-binding protein